MRRHLLFTALTGAVVLLLPACGSGNATTQTVTVTAQGGGSSGGATSAASSASSTSNSSAGSTSSSASQPVHQLAVVGGSFNESVQFGTRQVSYYAMVKNKGTQTFDQAEVDTDFLSKNGTVVASEQDYVNLIQPGQEFPVTGTDTSVSSTRIAKMRVRISTPYNWLSSFPSGLIKAHLSTWHAASSYGTYELHATAALSSTFSQDAKQVPVVFLFFGPRGKFVDYDDEYANIIPAHGKAQQTIDQFPNQTVTRIAVYASLDSGSQLGNQSLY